MSARYKYIIFISFLLISVYLKANNNNSENIKKESAAQIQNAVAHDEEFNAGEMIIEHVLDAHEWHIMTIGGNPIAICLPVILFDNGKLHFFLSSKFEHGKSNYEGFKIEKEGPNKGKIVKAIGNTLETDTTASLPLDISITKNTFSLFFSVFLLFFIFITIARKYKKYPNTAPKGFQSLIEPLIIFVRDDIAKSAIGEKNYEKYTPYLLSLFFFILINNVLGLIPIFPGGANLTGNITVTMVLALFTFFITQFLGTKNYWKHIFNTPGVPWYLKFPLPLMPLIELVSLFIKPFVLMIRLFANITAGHIIGLGFVSLILILGKTSMGLGYGITAISVPLSIFMTFVELLVAFIQAFVFTLLTAFYFSSAVEEAHH